MAAPNQVLSLGSTSTLRTAGRSGNLDLADLEHRARAARWPPRCAPRRPSCRWSTRGRARGRPRSARVSSQWWRDTVSSVSTRSLSGALPMRSFSPSGAWLVPLALPESTITWMPDVRRRRPDRARLGLDVLLAVVASGWSPLIAAPTPRELDRRRPACERDVPACTWLRSSARRRFRSPPCSPRRAAAARASRPAAPARPRSGRSPRASSRSPVPPSAPAASHGPACVELPHARRRVAEHVVDGLLLGPGRASTSDDRQTAASASSAADAARRLRSIRSAALQLPDAGDEPLDDRIGQVELRHLVLARSDDRGDVRVGHLGLPARASESPARGASAPSARRPCPWRRGRGRTAAAR